MTNLANNFPVEFFPSLGALPFVRHAFIGRIPGLDVTTDRAEALRRLDAEHRTLGATLGFDEKIFVTAEQVHGNRIALIHSAPEAGDCFGGTDGLITQRRDISLGIYVADCCAVFLVDPVQRAIGLVHSGKKGTELAIVSRAIDAMQQHFATDPANLIVQLSPCIRPPHYEVDFAIEIVRQARSAGVRAIHDSGICTACHLARYYSYRAEKARTGRMLALLALA